MIIKRPISKNSKTQAFGDNLACAKQVNGETVRPFVIRTKTLGSCPLNYVPFYPELNMLGHNGEDWKGNIGDGVYFPVEADVEWWSRSEVDPDGGIGLDVFSSKRIHLEELPPQAGKLARREYEANNGRVFIKFRFWHLNKVLIKDAKRQSPDVQRPSPNVTKGQLIAEVGNTGASSGSHLHFSMKIVAENSMTLDGDNGYTGAVDFNKWYINEFILDTPMEPQQTLLRITLLKIIAQLTALRDALQKRVDEKNNS